MNRRQLEVQKIAAGNEEKVIKQLKEVYELASKDCADKIRELSMRTDMENLKSIIWQKRYQEALKNQIDGVLDMLSSNSFATITDYLTECYENGFFGTLYDLQGQGIPLIFPINQKEAVQAIQADSKLSEGYYKRLGEDTGYLKKLIRTELSRGVSNGESWNQIAERIAGGMYSPFNKAYKNALRIARTEGHRIRQEATYHCQQRVKSKGADIVKQWDSTLDNVTRPHHVELDGQVREVDTPFEVAGLKAMYPGAFGIASEDIHCRCCLLQRARWEVTEEEYYDKWNGDKRELVKVEAKTYNEFKEKAKQYFLKMQFPDDVYKIKGMTEEVRNELEAALIKLKSEYDIRLNSISVEAAGEHDIFVTGYHDGIMDMIVNKNADFDKIIRKIQYDYERGYFAGKSLEDYIAHEMAHVMLYQDCKTDIEYKAKYQQIESLYGLLRGVSRYADNMRSGNEALAEAFVRVRNREDVPPVMKILVESYYKEWRKQ